MSVGGCLALSAIIGFVIRASLHGGGPALLMMGVLLGLCALFLLGEIVTALQVVQAREAAAEALARLPSGYRVSGRIRVRGAGRRPAVADHVVVCPDGRTFAVMVDGSTRPPRPGDPAEGLARLLGGARRVAESIQEAAAARVLPEELGLRPGSRVRPCIVVARRPVATAWHDGVLAVSAPEAAGVLARER